MRKISLVLLSTSIALFSCSKEKPESSPVELKSGINTYVAFELPNEVNPNNLEDYTTTYIDTIYGVDASGNSELYGYVFHRYDGNALISVEVSTKINEFISVPADLFVADWEEDLILNWEAAGKRSFGEWLRHVFWGDPFQGPCLWGQADNCVDHWLVGVHSCEQGPC